MVLSRSRHRESLERIARVHCHKGVKTGIIYVQADLVKDTTFPSANGDSLHIRIDGERLIVEKASKRKKD